MIEKILDNYFTRKLLKEIEWCLFERNLDYKFADNGTMIDVIVKPEKYDKKYSRVIISFWKSDAFKYMCELKKFLKYVKEELNEYIREEKND